MSSCEEYGKDKVVFLTKEDTNVEPNIKLSEFEDDYNRGLILPNGDINFNCPCLGGMASGPCGVEFREAFSCFHYSKAENKGSECLDKFLEMQSCMTKYPSLYPNENAAMAIDPSSVDDLEIDNKHTSSEAITKTE